MLRIVFLGTGGTLPTPNRNPSAILINREGELFLFDCGEGTQQQMMRAKTGMTITSIYITHFHADHILGIPGLIQTMSFNGRTDPLTIYGPRYVKEFTRLLIALGYYKLRFKIDTQELKPGDMVKRDGYTIEAVQTDHGIPSLGYVLQEEERAGRFNKEKALALGIPEGPLFSKLQKGETVFIKGREVRPEEVLGKPRPGRKIVYTGDTRPSESVVKASLGADVLIHDGTLADSLKDWAIETKHSTAGEAALIAKQAGVCQLILTHISSRYSEDISGLLEDAKNIFKDVRIAEEFLTIDVLYRE